MNRKTVLNSDYGQYDGPYCLSILERSAFVMSLHRFIRVAARILKLERSCDLLNSMKGDGDG